ncbi:hypothetical protein SUGI_0713170 [Cryptomeria japonica]|nr:hypothetical protein SUGI_0713170 [Cryptomeria japonica]
MQVDYTAKLTGTWGDVVTDNDNRRHHSELVQSFFSEVVAESRVPQPKPVSPEPHSSCFPNKLRRLNCALRGFFKRLAMRGALRGKCGEPLRNAK